MHHVAQRQRGLNQRPKQMAGDNNKVHIRLHVYDMELPVTIIRDEEEFYRNAAKLITETVNNYAQVFRGRKSDKELLYMALIDIALRYVKDKDRNDTSPYDDILAKITSEIEEVL